jgi:hypothetical protein
MNTDVYGLLVDELCCNIYISEETAREVVQYLADNDFIDYDNLKEAYIYEEEN